MFVTEGNYCNYFNQDCDESVFSFLYDFNPIKKKWKRGFKSLKQSRIGSKCLQIQSLVNITYLNRTNISVNKPTHLISPLTMWHGGFIKLGFWLNKRARNLQIYLFESKTTGKFFFHNRPLMPQSLNKNPLAYTFSLLDEVRSYHKYRF